MKFIHSLIFLLFVYTSAGQPLAIINFAYETAVAIRTSKVYPLVLHDSRTQIIQFAQGFFDGIGATKVFSEIQNCIGDSEHVLLNLGIAIQDLRTKNPEKVREGIRIIGETTKIIPEAAQLCHAADSDINKIINMIKSFTNPSSVIYHAGKSLLINRVEVFHEILHAIQAYQKQDYRELGYWVGQGMVTVFLKSSKNLRNSQSYLTDFTQGFVDGIGAPQIFGHIEGCLFESHKLLADLEIDLKDFDLSSPGHMLEGLRILELVAKVVPKAAKLCQVADADMQKVIHLVKIFVDPASVACDGELSIDWVQAYSVAMRAKIAYEKHDFKDLGYWIGQAMDTIFIKSQRNTKTSSSADILNFVEGFLEGAGSASAFDELKKCVGDSEIFVTDITTGVEDIKTKNPAKVKTGIQLIGQAVQIIPDAAKLCKASEIDLETLMHMIESFKSPASFFYYVGKSLIINHVEVISEVKSAIAAYDSKDAKQLGYWIGKAMDTILLGQGQTMN